MRRRYPGSSTTLGPKAMSLNRLWVASCFLRQQQAWVDTLHELCLQRRPVCGATLRKWGETKERLLVPIGQVPARGCWEVLVSAVRLVISWRGKPLFVLDLVSPPSPVDE